MTLRYWYIPLLCFHEKRLYAGCVLAASLRNQAFALNENWWTGRRGAESPVVSVIGIFRQLTAWIALKLLTFIDLRDL